MTHYTYVELNLIFSCPSHVCHREEISTLSRQASVRRVNSVSPDARGVVLTLNYYVHTQ